jgi:hypothetical protein
MTTTKLLRRGLVLLTLVGAAASGGCSRAHMSSYYGQSFNAWFAMQHVRHEPAEGEATKRALSHLDAQEASAISKSYRRNVGGGQEAQGGQMVMMGSGRGSAEPYTPPPSVPGGQ